ncbi:hypothetical protein JD844_014792 [Phrynosoma platyrhinos]|uniref:Cathepsin H n=1 Tax=Phrynosoma platyrhinos TaxID=52577 RepID=A0ABQ7SS29_PHRPL|nr:hypothetical protein JD844_014792 [Phrynosoma platyrhinos]
MASISRPRCRYHRRCGRKGVHLLFLLFLGGLSFASASCFLPSSPSLLQNNKQYSLEEYHQRLQIFLSNKRRIDKHNADAGNHTFRMGLNQFSDMTFAEFRKKFLWREPQDCSATKGNLVRSTGPYPSAIDWRKKGNYVTPVKNQGPCGSCWTFSTTGCLESAIAIATGKLLELSEQQLVDCAQAFNNHGCSGGLPSQAFEYILYNGGLMDEDGYPYHASNGTCKFQPGKAVAFVKDVVNITQPWGGKIRSALPSSSQCDKTPDKVNHAVLAVGFGEEEGLPYWIVKNSWGASWGMDGYFLIERGKNMCGLADCASYPVPRV